MAQLTHRQKQRLARKNRTKSEINHEPRIGIFETEFWNERARLIRQRINNSGRHKNKLEIA